MQSASSPPQFYPFGTGAGDTKSSTGDDLSSPIINLTSPFSFFGHSYSQLYVNNNGFLTFNQADGRFQPVQFNSNYSGSDIIAPFWTDMDNNLNGTISYNQYTVGNVLSQATQDINQYFPGVTFSAQWVFVATWDKVAYFQSPGTQSSFQVVLISNGNSSFVLMNYGAIATTKWSTEAGYVSSTQRFTFLWATSNTVVNLSNSSNVGVPGRWAFSVNGAPGSSTTTNFLTGGIIGLRLKVTTSLNLTDTNQQKIILQRFQDELSRKGLQNAVRMNVKQVQKTSP